MATTEAYDGASSTGEDQKEPLKGSKKIRRRSATFEELDLELLLQKPGELVCNEDGCPNQVMEGSTSFSENEALKPIEGAEQSLDRDDKVATQQKRASESSRTSSDSRSRSSNELRESTSLHSVAAREFNHSSSLDKSQRGLPPTGGRVSPSPRDQTSVRASRSSEDFPPGHFFSNTERFIEGVLQIRSSGERDRSSHPITDAIRSKSGQYRFADMFKLPHTQRLVDRFSCGLKRAIILQGTLYVFNEYVCFRSIILTGANIVMPISEIASIRRERNLLLDNAIRFTLRDGTSHLFVSFLFPARAYRELRETGLFQPDVFEDRSDASRRSSNLSPREPAARKTSRDDQKATTNDSQTENKSMISVSEDDDAESEDEEDVVRSVEQSMAIRLFAAGQLPSYPNRKKHLLQSEKAQMTRVCAITLPCNNARLFRAFFIDLEEEEALLGNLENGKNATSSPAGNEHDTNSSPGKTATPSTTPRGPTDTTAASGDKASTTESETLAFSARSNFLAFQSKLGHQDMELGKWHLDRELGFVREFRYRKPLEPAPMSPKETWMTEHMMFYVTGHEQDKLQTIFLEIQGTSHDVPFGDSFVAEQLYIFRPAQENSRFECELEVYAGAHFHHWSMVAGTIRKRTIAGVEKTANIFVQMARELCTTSLCRRLRERERAQYEAGITEPVTPQPAEVTPDVIEETTVPSSVVETKLEPITFEALPLPTRYVLLPFYRLSVMASSAAYWDATLLNAFTILCMTLLSFWVFRLHISNQQLIAELRRADEQLHFLRDVLADRLRN
ncbi:hypothetical protein CCYA_CCYA02G0478 [Cyanidiococcus yangmingshanensis]|nr:hypothetical protein CCYA_CCYA02G0478 [Cyanidiococcus yangmingshanensis]